MATKRSMIIHRIHRVRALGDPARSRQECSRHRYLSGAGFLRSLQLRGCLEACRECGLALRMHGDQFTERGAIPLGGELGARSVDHLEATGGEGSKLLARSDVTGVLLPGGAFFLDLPLRPARYLVEE